MTPPTGEGPDPPRNQFGNKFDLALKAGEEFEDFFRGLVANATVECKKDYVARETGNLFVEFECRNKASGLSVTQADWWAFGIVGADGNVERIVLVSTSWLKRECRRLFRLGRIAKGGDDGLSRGVLLPLTSVGREGQSNRVGQQESAR